MSAHCLDGSDLPCILAVNPLLLAYMHNMGAILINERQRQLTQP